MKTATLLEQSDFISHLADRCIMHDGAVAGTAHLTMTPEDVAALQFLAGRLLRMSPFQAKIEKLVTGK